MEQLVCNLAIAYIAVMGMLGFILMGIDKRRAIKKKWRVQEKTLLMVAVLGGGIGSFLGMILFRHKIRHLAFMILLPLAAAAYAGILLKICRII